MIRLTERLVMIADQHCYTVGEPRSRPGRGVEIVNPRYYTSVSQAIRGAIETEMRAAVQITTLEGYIQREEALKANLEKLLARITP